MKSLIHTTAVLGSFIASSAAFAAAPIVGGTTVAASNLIARRTVGLLFVLTVKNGKPDEYATCSGSILDNSRILTAAHCVHGGFKQGFVIFSTKNVSKLFSKEIQSGPSAVPEFHLVTTAREEPGYSGQQSGTEEFNDLAVVNFAGGLAPGYEPAQFLLKQDAVSKLAKGAALTLAGYGMTTPPPANGAPSTSDGGSGTLRKVSVKSAGFAPKGIDLLVQGTAGHDACEGDSGGPALLTAKGETYVVGVLSRGNCHDTSIYTFVNQEIVSGL